MGTDNMQTEISRMLDINVLHYQLYHNLLWRLRAASDWTRATRTVMSSIFPPWYRPPAWTLNGLLLVLSVAKWRLAIASPRDNHRRPAFPAVAEHGIVVSCARWPRNVCESPRFPPPAFAQACSRESTSSSQILSHTPSVARRTTSPACTVVSCVSACSG